MLTPHAVDKLVICAVFNWLRGLEPLATTPWQQQCSVRGSVKYYPQDGKPAGE